MKKSLSVLVLMLLFQYAWAFNGSKDHSHANGEVITAYVFADNYFEMYINGTEVGKDNVPFTQFNSDIVRFSVNRPFTVAMKLVDWEIPAEWTSAAFDDSSWPAATTYTNATIGVDNKSAYTNFTDIFDASTQDAQFIWSTNVVLDNEVIVRKTFQ